MIEIKRLPGSRPINVKRLYLPYIVTMPCPECAVVCTRDLRRDPAPSYPVLGEPVNLYGYCTACNAEWEMLVNLDVQISTTEATTTEDKPKIRVETTDYNGVIYRDQEPIYKVGNAGVAEEMGALLEKLGFEVHYQYTSPAFFKLSPEEQADVRALLGELPDGQD